MGFWVGNTPKFLYLYEVHGDEIILPYGTLKQIQPMIKDAIFSNDFEPFESIEYGQPIPLYPYQQKAVDEAATTEKITPLSAWKDTYFEKDERDNYRLKDRIANKKLFCCP